MQSNRCRPIIPIINRHIDKIRFSTATGNTQLDASKYVSGVTSAELESNALLQSFYEANFPQFSKSKSSKDDTYRPRLAKTEQTVEEPKDETVDQHVRTLSCYLRTMEGSRRCQSLRDQRMIPGIIYGSDPTKNIRSLNPTSKILVQTPWSLIQREFDRFTYHKFESKVYDLIVYESAEDTTGTIHRVTPRNVQHHPIKNTVYCVNYLRYFPGKPISIPILYINEEESAALKRGGFIAPVSRYVSCVIDEGIPVPTHLELECTGLKLKDVIRLDRIIFPPGIRASKHVNTKSFLVGTVFGRRADTAEEKPEKTEKKTEKKVEKK